MNIVLIIIFFAVVAFLHATSLIFVKRSQGRSENWRLKVWKMHYAFNGTLWLILAGLIAMAQFTLPHHNFPMAIKVLGIALIFFGTTLAAKSYFLLGLDQAMGLRFFFPTKAKQLKSGVYHFLNNPMYDGFLFILLGLGLWLGVIEDFYLALMSFLLLNIFLATIENYQLKLNPF